MRNIWPTLCVLLYIYITVTDNCLLNAEDDMAVPDRSLLFKESLWFAGLCGLKPGLFVCLVEFPGWHCLYHFDFRPNRKPKAMI